MPFGENLQKLFHTKRFTIFFSFFFDESDLLWTNGNQQADIIIRMC